MIKVPLARADDRQVGGEHYKRLGIQPWNVAAVNHLDWFQGEIVKYVVRYREKGGVDDLRKARHVLDKLIELVVNHNYPSRPLHEEDIVQILGLQVAAAPAAPAEPDATAVTSQPDSDEGAINRVLEAMDCVRTAGTLVAETQSGIVPQPGQPCSRLRFRCKTATMHLTTAEMGLKDLLNEIRSAVHE